jgi:hypothetical protein
MLEDNTTRELGGNPFRFVELLRELADAAPHRCRFIETSWGSSPENTTWLFRWEDDCVFTQQATPTPAKDAWGFFGPLYSRMHSEGLVALQDGATFLEKIVRGIISYYRHGGSA